MPPPAWNRVNPLNVYLENRLKGILIAVLPVSGPVAQSDQPFKPIEERYKVIGYADDVKPAISNMNEFSVVDKGMTLFEKASGCKLHRNPANKKCKFLPLAKWRGTLQQEDIPCNYMSLSDHLDMVGGELHAKWSHTRKANGEQVANRIKDTFKKWKTGKFMDLSLRNWSINMYCY